MISFVTGTLRTHAELSVEVEDLKIENHQLREDLQERIKCERSLRNENEALKEQLKKQRFCYENIDDNNLGFYTGLPSVAIFVWLLCILKHKVKSVTKFLSFQDHLLVILMKLRLGLLNKDLALRFNVSEPVLSKIIRNWLPLLAKVLSPLIIWPSRKALRKNLPKCFQSRFRNCVSVIDCSEIFIERPLNLTARAQTWSTYKHHNTIKYLLGVTPAGAVGFLSDGWGGRASDKKITLNSGLLSKLQKGDQVLADRGFNLREEFAAKGATLYIPCFTKGKKQLSACEVDTSRQLSHCRIHVERVIGRIKQFKILQTVIPISQVKLLNDIIIVCSALVNLNKSVVPQ